MPFNCFPYHPAGPGYSLASHSGQNPFPARGPSPESPHWRQHSSETLTQHSWGFELGGDHLLLKTRLSNQFDSSNTLCFPYHSLVISMLLKRSMKSIQQFKPLSLIFSRNALTTRLWIGGLPSKQKFRL